MNLLVGALALSALAAASARAQVTTPGQDNPGEAVTAGHSSVFAGPYVGYMIFGNLDRVRQGVGTAPDVTLSLENSLFYGGQLGFSFSPNFTILANLGYSKSKFVLKDAGGEGQDANISENIGVFLYDGNLQFRLPFVANRVGSTIAPFGQIGVGQIKYTIDDNDLDAGSKGSDTDIAFNVGAGIDFQVRKAIGARIMVKDYITSLDFDDAGDTNESTKSRTANNIAITFGLNFGF